MGSGDLTIGILQHVGIGAVQVPGRPRSHDVHWCQNALRGARSQSLAAGLHPDEPHIGFIEECAEQADGIRAAAHASDTGVWQAPRLSKDLLAGFLADDRLKVAHDAGVRVRPPGLNRAGNRLSWTLVTQSRMASLMASFNVRVPLFTGAHFGAEQGACAAHLAAGEPYRRYHVDDAFQSEQSRSCGCGYPCWPAPVSAMMRRLPMCSASKACPRALLILSRRSGQIFTLQIDMCTPEDLLRW